MVAILFFLNEAKIVHRHVFYNHKHSLKFSEYIFINEQDVKVYVKM